MKLNRFGKKKDFTKFKDYHEYYLKGDVLLLADCFEAYRQKCMEYYGLDPAWYWTNPSLAEAVALKISEIRLKLINER
jgi:hypothetical protein